MPADKEKAVVDFILGLQELKDVAKEDSRAILKTIPLEVLGDAEALKDFLRELAEAVIRKNLITDEGRIRPEAARLVRGYVREMRKK